MNRSRWAFVVLGASSICALLSFQVFRNVFAQSRQWTPFQADMVDRQYNAGKRDPVLELIRK